MLRWKIHHRRCESSKRKMTRIFAVVGEELPIQFSPCSKMAQEIAGKARKLYRLWINQPAFTRPPRRHGFNDILAKPFQRMRAQAFNEAGGVGQGVHRTAYQDKRTRRHFRLVRREKRGRRKCGHDGLADADNMQLWTKHTDHFGDVTNLFFEPETACRLWQVTGIEPVGDRNHAAVPEKVDHEVTEQYRKSSRKRGDHQDLILVNIGAGK